MNVRRTHSTIPVTMAKGKHLFPSRTQQLSPSAPRVLSWTRLGRVGRCRLPKEAIANAVAFSFGNNKATSLPSRNSVRFCSALALRRGTTRRLGRLVCALLRFRERPRTVEVQRTTSSPQNHRKSLAQYCMVLLIQLFRSRLIIWIVFMIAILQRRKCAPVCAVFSGLQLPIYRNIKIIDIIS